MPINLNSRIKEVLQHPVGQDVIQKLMRHIGRREDWPCGAVVGRFPVSYLDRLAGKGFAESLVALLNSQTMRVAVQGGAIRPAWWRESVFYRIYLPSFMDSDHDGVGDVMGIVQRLPYLKKIGVNALWLTPFLGSEKEYQEQKSILDFSSEFGQKKDFGILQGAADAQNIKLILEADIRSTSNRHPWFLKALAGEEKYQNYYHIRQGTQDKPPVTGGYSSALVWRWYGEISSWVLSFSGRARADLNWQNPDVRQEIFASLLEWKEQGAAGFAFSPISALGIENFLDATSKVADVCGFEQYTYSEQLHSNIKEIREALGEETLVMAEMPGIAPEMAKLFTAGCQSELDMVWSNVHLRASNRSLADEGRIYLQDIKEYFLQWQDNSNDLWQTLFFGSHNLPRMISRIGANAIYRSTVAKMLGTMLLTLRGTPVVYQGEELGLPNTRFSTMSDLKSRRAQQMYDEFSAKLGEATAFEKMLLYTPDHSRTPMPWAPGCNAGFTGALPWIRTIDGADHLNATVQMQDKSSVFNHYQKLIEIRNKSVAMKYGAFNPVFVKNKAVFCYFRIIEGEKWYVEINITGREINRPGRILQSQKLMASNYDTQGKALRPYEANVYYCE